jgi:hypothetical protein
MIVGTRQGSMKDRTMHLSVPTMCLEETFLMISPRVSRITFVE